MPQYAYVRFDPYKYHEDLRIRRYGFHGTSHFYVTKMAAKFLEKEMKDLNAITLHLGNGASVTAIENGESADNLR